VRYNAPEMGRTAVGTGSTPSSVPLHTQEGTITVGAGPVYRSQGLAAEVATIVNSTDLLRFSDQAESSVNDPAAGRHADIVLRAAVQAEDLRADVDTCVLTARTDAAEAPVSPSELRA
jgi:hypothetical protein